MIGIILLPVLSAAAYVAGLARGRSHASTVIDNPQPGPTADAYYHKVKIDGDIAYFTQEQVDTAIARADRLT